MQITGGGISKTDTVPSTVYKNLDDKSQVNVQILGKMYKVQQNPAEVFVDISNIMRIDVSPVKFIGDIDELYMMNLWVRNERNKKELNKIILR